MFRLISDDIYGFKGNEAKYFLEYIRMGHYNNGEGWRLKAIEYGVVNTLVIFVTKDDGNKCYSNPLCKDCRSWSFDDIYNKAEKIVNNYEHI